MAKIKVEVQEVTLTGIDRQFSTELKQDIDKVTRGKLFFNDDYPALKLLYRLLDGCFYNQVNGVHFIDRGGSR